MARGTVVKGNSIWKVENAGVDLILGSECLYTWPRFILFNKQSAVLLHWHLGL